MKNRFLLVSLSLIACTFPASAQFGRTATEPNVQVGLSATLDNRVYSAPPLLASTPAVPLAAGRESLTDRQYAEAIKELSAAASDKTNGDEALLLLGNAHLEAKEYSNAIAAYNRIAREFPESKWSQKALFQKADAYVAQGQWKEAAAIYEKQMEYIVSDERREKIAATYLKYADIYFEPKEDKTKAEPTKPDFNRAKTLYLKALEIGLTPSRTGEVLLRVALADFNSNNFPQAIAGFERVRREYPQSAAAAEALRYIGLARLKAGDGRGARRALRDFTEDYPDRAKRADAYIAIAESWRVPNPQNSRDLEMGVAALREFIEKFPNHERALQAEYWIGLSYFNLARYEDAGKEFSAFIAHHPNADNDELALAKNQLGFVYLRQKKFAEAIAAWEKFLAEHPVHRLWNDVQRQVIDANYAIGEEAYKAKNYEAARKAWDAFTQKYPLDVRNADIMFRLGMMQHDAEKYDEAIAQWRRVVSKYSGSEAASRAQYMIALTFEKLNRWDDAFAALKLVQGQFQAQAIERIATLKNRRLVVYTERAFRTNETPNLRLVTRNVARVSMRAYRVDLRDYFSKTQTIRDVDKLDLNLIAPDQTWDVEIDKYAPYRESETIAQLPFKGAGVWAIVCRAENEKAEVTPTLSTPALGKLEATSVVSITDVGLITKATKNDVFVWSQNLVTGQPVAGAQVLISNSEKIIARGVTDEAGVYHFQRPREEAGADTTPTQEPKTAPAPKPKKPNAKKPKVQPVALKQKPTAPALPVEFPEDAIRVLAVKDSYFASTEDNLNAVAQVASLAPTGVLYTDRPLYRAGQTVQMKGIVRQVRSGAYAFSPGAEYSLAVTSPAGATIHAQRVKLNEWGTFSEKFDLPDEAEPGNYRLVVSRQAAKDGPQIQSFLANGYFSVAAYQLDKVRLQIEMPKSVFLRGEEIKGTVEAKYYYDEALRNRKVRFGWKDNVGSEIQTNDKGQFEFTIPTRDFEEDEAIRLWARFEEEGAATTAIAYVASVGVNAGLSTLRNVYLANEPFDVEIKTTDLAGKPFAGSFDLRAFKLEKNEDIAGQMKTGEREVLRQTANTKDGAAKINLQLKESGDYILRLEGRDASGNPVSNEIAVQIVGDDDETRLRLLPETDTLKAGETAAIRVLWRGEKADGKKKVTEPTETLALVTYEADRVYGHQIVKLAKGENTIQVPVASTLAPTFRLSISLMNGDRFHQASKWFTATRDLKVEVRATRADGKPLEKGASLRPGEKVRVQIIARDQNGKPVAAELSLAAVDEALLLASGNQQIPIAAFLGRRDMTSTPVLTSASNTFNFTAEARRQVFEVREAEKFFRVQLSAQEYPDIPVGHWSYDALNKLSSVGIIEGYPSGTYSGGRAMTRYEMAVAVARTLENELGKTAAGARPELNDALNALVLEYKPELSALGVRTDDLDARVTALENRVTKAPRLTQTPSLLHRTGKANYIRQGMYYDENAAADGFFEPGQQGAAGPQGAEFSREMPSNQLANIKQSRNGVISSFGIGGSFSYSDRDLQLSDGTSPYMLSSGVDPAVYAVLRSREAGNDAPTVRENFAETAFWNAHIVTGEDGQASAEFTVPDSLTQWRLSAKGISKDSLAGEGESSFASSRPFWVELQSPPVLQSGDNASISAVVHNDSDVAISAKVSLNSSFDGKDISNSATVEIPARASEEARFEVAVPEAREATLSAAATAGNERDSEVRVLPVRAWGIDQTASASGLAQNDRSIEVALPDAKYSSNQMTITVGPHTPSALLDIAANPSGFGWRAPLAESTALRLMAAVEAARYLKKSGGDERRYDLLSREIQSLVARLSTSQNSDGGWTWALSKSGGQNDERQSSLPITSESLAGLSGARELGFSVVPAVLEKANAYLLARYQNSSEETEKAMIVWAQSKADTADFAHANRLYRLRNGLDARALAFLSLALHEMVRDEMASEVLDLLQARTSEEALRAALNKPFVATSENALNLNRVDELALMVWATSEIEPASTLLSPAAQLLWAQRNGRGWSTPRATSYAVSALLKYAEGARLAPEKYTLAITVNGVHLQTLNIDSNSEQTTIEVPVRVLSGSKAKVNFNLEGRGTFAYSVVLNGWTQDGLLDDEAVKPRLVAGKTDEWEAYELPSSGGLSVSRSYRPASNVWNGKIVPSGFSILRQFNENWSNAANEVRVGERVGVALNWQMPYEQRMKIGQTTVLRESLPSGARVLEESISGNFERYELGDREITFYFNQEYSGSVTYDLYGARPGNYRVLPTKVWSFENPGFYAFSTYKNFKVLPRGAKGSDEYRITPDEMYYLAKWSFDRAAEAELKGQTPETDDWKLAEKYLTDLFNRDADPKGWKLQEGVGKDITRMLYSLALKNEDAPLTVRYFEVLRERFPDLVIGFPEIVRTAKAYGKIGEVEREVQVLRATAEASFKRETGVAGTLVEQGEHRASYEFLAERVREYPDLANVESTTYTLAQTIAARAEQLNKENKVAEAKELNVLASVTMRDFLTMYPENPLGDEASFALAVNLVEQGQFKQSVAWARRAKARYVKTDFADDYDYIITYASFLDENYDDALKGAQTLAATEYSKDSGDKALSPYRSFALYIAAQIYHARGEVGLATEYYRLVSEQFPDAREAADYFEQKSLQMTEVVVARPGEPATIKVTARNVKEAQVSVYKVDLLQFYQERRNLVDLGKMNLAGITPTWQGVLSFEETQSSKPKDPKSKPKEAKVKEVKADKPADNPFSSIVKTLTLPLPEKGAYFVTVQAEGGKPVVSGVVVRSSLEIGVQEDAESGRLRVNIAREGKNGTESVVQPKVEVWAVGSDNDEFRKGTTDLRGLVALDDLRGRATVIAHKDGEYAFYRGDITLQPQMARSNNNANNNNNGSTPTKVSGAKKDAFKEEARNAYMTNQNAITNRNAQSLQSAMQNNSSNGVAVGQAY